MYHTCYFYISLNFPGKALLGQCISYFYRRWGNSKGKDPKTMKNWHQKLRDLAKRDSSLCPEDVSLQLSYLIPLFPLTGNVVSTP